MRYQIKREESVTDAARRLIGEELDDALAVGRDARVTVDERVHQIRVGLKRARAIVALVAPGCGRAAKRDNRALREIARGLAASRDRAVAREALTRVSKQLAASGRAPRGPSKLAPRLRRHLSEDGTEARLHDAVRDLEHARRSVGRFRVKQGRAAVAAGFESAYRRARRALRRVAADDDAELFHEWRKIVKRLGYQVALLGDAASSSFGALEPLLDRLGKLLGELHDLAFLGAAVSEVGAAREVRAERTRWLALLDARASDLRREARALGIPLFADAPSSVRRRVEADWSRWRR